MKTTMDNPVEAMYNNEFRITKCSESATTFTLNMKTKRKKGICPCCNQESTSLHSTYTRDIEDTPFHNKNVHLHITAYRFYCENKECKSKVFMEDLKIADKNQVRTHYLNQFIILLAARYSSEGTSRILKELNINVSNDTIDRLLNRIELVDDIDIEEIGIDDISFRKGHNYCTAIYDLKTHKLIGLIDGRSADDLSKWLSAHKKVKIVTRDRASAYAKAIREVLPDCIQVADKFHLMQNLIDCLRDVIKSELPKTIFIKDGEVLDSEPKKVKKLSNKELTPSDKNYNYDNTPVIDDQGNIVSFDNRLNRCLIGKEKQKIENNRKKKRI